MQATVICPTANRRAYIPMMLKSFLSQTVTDSELVIVDDGIEVIADLIPSNPRIRYTRLPNISDAKPVVYGGSPAGRRSIGSKRNLCCAMARGEFILHFDDDDWSAAGRIEHQINHMKRMNAQVMSYYGTLYLNTGTSRLYLFDPRGACINGATLCYRKSWWEQHCFQDQQLGEDTIFGESAAHVGGFALLNADKFMVIRTHTNNSCVSARAMGGPTMPEVSLDYLPEKFIQDTL
jgi:glycosyltransferase involved in cell wall biosynthesis